MTDPRDTYRWKQLRARLTAAAATHCPECHRPFVRGARRNHPRMPTLDHITPLHMGGDPYNPANLRVICYGCNARRGALTRTAAQRNQATIRRLWRSRVW